MKHREKKDWKDADWRHQLKYSGAMVGNVGIVNAEMDFTGTM